MENPIPVQLAQAALAVLLGAGLGFCYDFLRLMPLAKWLSQLLFGFVLLPSLILFGLYAGQGEFRIFFLPMMLGGALVYFLLLSPPVRAFGTRFWSFLHNFFQKILFFLKKPLFILKKIVYNNKAIMGNQERKHEK